MSVLGHDSLITQYVCVSKRCVYTLVWSSSSDEVFFFVYNWFLMFICFKKIYNKHPMQVCWALGSNASDAEFRLPTSTLVLVL